MSKPLAVILQKKVFLFKLTTFVRSNLKTFGLMALELSSFNELFCETYLMYIKKKTTSQT